jgi:YesN/AraC family two-component response regulator
MSKKNLTLMSPPVENETLPEEFVKIAEEENKKVESSENEERENIDFISEEDEDVEEVLSGIKIKEVKYGFSVLTNIGNYENIRTQIEVTAEIEENDQMIDCINSLSKQIKDWGRQEYRDIKQKAMATLPKREN